MARTLKFDKTLFLATLLLVAASVVMVYSASAVQADARYQKSYLFLSKQLAWVVMGLTFMIGVMRVDYSLFYKRVHLSNAMGTRRAYAGLD
jgi:cell division protein FtsW (lipid II flippase)